MSRIWAWILTLLISIFPSLNRYSPPLDVDKSVAAVISAFKTRDINAIEAFMCKNIKDNVLDLRGEIGKMIDAMQGEIISYSATSGGAGFNGSSGGRRIEQTMAASNITTSAGNYKLSMLWETYNNFSLAERGVREISLYLMLGDGYEILARFEATDGGFKMHD